MSILFPLMALGAITAAVPIWLHLRRRDEKNLVEFSALRFLDDQPIARARPLLPRNWPLLILRLVALLCLVAAFMWPYVEGKETVIVEESRVYILDNTLSHQVDDGFVRDRDRVVEQLDQRDVRTQIGVVELGSTPNILARFGDDPIAAAEQISRLEPSDQRGVYFDAFRSAAEMLSHSLGQRRRIVLLSDNQANQWGSGEEVPPFLNAIEVEIPQPAKTSRANSSLSEPLAQRVVRDGRHWIEAGAMASLGPQVESAVVTFRSRGREVARQEISLTSEETQTDRSGFVVATWEAEPDQWILGEVIIEADDDALANDNRVVFSLPPVRPGRVELIADSLFLRQALEPHVMLGRWEVRRIDPSRQDTEIETEPPDVLCVESHWISSPRVRDRILDSLNGGSGVMLLVDQITPLVAGFLREVGIESQPSPSRPSDPATFRYVFGEHPIFEPFRSGQLGNLVEIQFNDYRRLRVRDSIPLAFSISGDPLLFEVQGRTGRMLVFAFAMNRDDSNWPIHPSFIPFLDKSLDYLRGNTVNETSYEPGELVTWNVEPGVSAEHVFVSKLRPDAESPTDEDGEPTGAEVRDREARFRVPSKSGHYGVRYEDGGPIAGVLDVNPSPMESELIYESAPKALDSWKGTGEPEEPKAEDATLGIELTTLEALQQHYWWYLLLIAVVAFVAETIWSARFSQES